jgi:hypothetical protein
MGALACFAATETQETNPGFSDFSPYQHEALRLLGKLGYLSNCSAVATDNIGVAGYYVYRDGARIAEVMPLLFGDAHLRRLTEYCYEVTAFDSARNESTVSDDATAVKHRLRLRCPSSGRPWCETYARTVGFGRSVWARLASLAWQRSPRAASQVHSPPSRTEPQDRQTYWMWHVICSTGIDLPHISVPRVARSSVELT